MVKLIKVQFASTDQVTQLGSMGLDIWEVNADHVIAAADAELLAQIQQQGFRVEVISEDAWNYLKTQSARAARAAAATTAAYHSHAEVITMLTDMEASGVAQTYNIDLCETHDFRSMITYHSYGSEVACTWGYTTDPTPDFCRDRHMADVMETLINDVHDAGYTSPEYYGYLTSGDTTDWTYGIFRIPSITMELRPKTYSEGGFILPENQIIPTCEENLPAALYLIGWNQADLNSDYTVNLQDMAILSSYWLWPGGCDMANLCCDGADIFGSDTVDADDLTLFANEWQAQSIVDSSAPSPDPMTFSLVPAATGDSSIAMTASVATDISRVQYYFTCTAGGGNDSGWQDSRTYEDTGLAPETQYTYTVIARDKSANHNATAASDPVSATTHSPDLTIPTPNTMTWNTVPNARSSSVISMTATTASI